MDFLREIGQISGMKIIDHDPNEKPPLPGETAFVTICTVVVLTLLGVGFHWLSDAVSFPVFMGIMALFAIAMFRLAFWLERN